MRHTEGRTNTWPQRKRSRVQGALYGQTQANLAAPLASKTGLSTLSPQKQTMGPKAQGASHGKSRRAAVKSAHSTERTVHSKLQSERHTHAHATRQGQSEGLNHRVRARTESVAGPWAHKAWPGG